MPKPTDILMRSQQRQNNEERFLRLQTTCGLQITHQYASYNISRIGANELSEKSRRLGIAYPD